MIDHTGHPHPSTPAMRALCRANGGTGSTAKPAGGKAPASKKAATKKQSRTSLNIDTGKQISREKAAKIMFGSQPKHQSRGSLSESPSAAKRSPGLTESRVPIATPQFKATAKTSNALVRSGIGRKLEQTPADRAKAEERNREQAARLKRIAERRSSERHDKVMADAGDEDAQTAALESAAVGITDDGERGFTSDDEKDAVETYISAGYGFVNSMLRGSSKGDDDTREQLGHLDAVMKRSKLSRDVAAFRGVDRGRVLFGDSLDGDMTGLEWREKGFSSTTVNPDVADDFTLSDDDEGDGDSTPVKMRIVLPKGTAAIQGSDLDSEAELIIGRDSGFRVVKDRGEDSEGVRILDVELVSQGGKDVS